MPKNFADNPIFYRALDQNRVIDIPISTNPNLCKLLFINVNLFTCSNKLNYFHNFYFRDKLKKVYQPTSQIGDTQCN